jgi:hypothetical protein
VRLEGITVVGTRAIETRTSEVATNVTEEQMRSLPQPDRNFLNFAGLAPGITVSHNETNKQITAAGLPATKINVFIDGASFKNDILEGGVHGQDASRGNPFPQIALQEFRVITQNFKAEYQRAASAIVTATTKSGTNEFRSTASCSARTRAWSERTPACAGDATSDRDELRAAEAGVRAAADGPERRRPRHPRPAALLRAYENNIQNRQAIVALGRPEFRPQFGQYEGTFDQPFRSHLGVAKLSYQPAENQTLT